MFVVQALLDTCHQFAHDDGLAFLHGCEIKHDILRRHTIFGCVSRVIVLLRTIEERFGRNTTYVEARTAYGVLLKQHDIFACFRGFFGGSVTGRAATDYG